MTSLKNLLAAFRLTDPYYTVATNRDNFAFFFSRENEDSRIGLGLGLYRSSTTVQRVAWRFMQATECLPIVTGMRPQFFLPSWLSILASETASRPYACARRNVLTVINSRNSHANALKEAQRWQ